MKNRKARRFSGAAESAKTALIGILAVSLVVLFAVYIAGMPVYKSKVAHNDSGSFDKLWSAQGGSEPEGLDGANLLPEFIGYKHSALSTARGCVGNKDSAAELYELIKPCLLELFGSSAKCTPLPGPFGEAVFREAQESDEFVYIRYHVPVLYQFIYAYASDLLTVSKSDVATGSEGVTGAYISELIIIPDKDFAAHRFVAYACDSEGQYYEFRPGEQVVASGFYISKLADTGKDSGTFEFEFFLDDTLSRPQPFIVGEAEYTLILSASERETDSETLNQLLRFLGYNPDKLSSYEDGTGMVYVDSYSQLKITDEKLHFTSHGTGADTPRGVEIDELLGYTKDGAHTVFDKLIAADNLTRRLCEISGSFDGGEASLCLGDVYTDGSLLTVEYFLTYGNIRVGSGPFLRAVVSDSSICELEASFLKVMSADKEAMALSPSYIYNKLQAVSALPENKKVEYVRLTYLDTTAEWAAYTKS